ncbi:MAG TPA: sugar phosphate isomerase/epimerase [Nitrososphaerales archaeon]|nr:sugar phosphate isomerase/epimerase [Nitrososphaerales archaeon]
MKVGLSTWSLLHSDIYTAVGEIGDAGFDYIELWGEVPHAYHGWVDKKRLKDTLSTYNFTMTMHAPFTDLNPATPFEPVKGAVTKTLRDFVNFASDLGATRVTFHPGSVHSGVLVPQSVKDVVILLRQLVKESDGRLVINIENQARGHSHYEFPVGSDAESIVTILSNTEDTSYTLDTGHAHANGIEPLKLYQRLRERTTEVHLSDNDGRNDDHLIPGRGTANLQDLLQRVEQTDMLVCLELNPHRYSADEVIKAATDFKSRVLP